MKNLLIGWIILLSSLSHPITAQTGTIKGSVIDKVTNDPLPFANIILFSVEKTQVAGTMTDFDGKFSLSGINPGEYIIECSYVGYQPLKLENILVHEGKITFANIKMPQGVDIKAFEVIEYEVPLISKDQTSSGGTVTRSRIRRMPGRSASDVAATVGGTRSNGRYNIRGSRSNSTDTYIDGIRTRGSSITYDDLSSESYNHWVENSYQDVIKNPLSTFSIDVDGASYTNIRRYINQNMLPPIDAVRIEEMINYFNYDYPQPEEGQPFSITTEYTNCPWNEKHKLVHIGLKGLEVDLENSPANNLVFLIDVSGSMDSPGKLPLLKSGLRLLVDKLRDNDKVSIVVYAGAAGLALSPTNGKHKDKIRDVIDRLDAGGSTAGGAGIKLAYRIAKKHFISNGNNRVILATDGDFNIGISDDKSLISLIEEKRSDNIFLSVLGFGSGNLKDSKMEQLANKGNGNYNYIDNILEAKKVLVKELGGTLITIAKDVKIQTEFNPKYVKAYRLIGYENRKLNDEDFNDDTKDAGELGSGHTVTALYEVIPQGSDELINNIDSLKYQRTTGLLENNNSSEILTVKFRYKNPKGNVSKLMTKILLNTETSIMEASTNSQFSAAVAEFGMLLRKSEYKGDANYKSILSLAKNSKGEDDNGYRAEFIRLVEMAELIR